MSSQEISVRIEKGVQQVVPLLILFETFTTFIALSRWRVSTQDPLVRFEVLASTLSLALLLGVRVFRCGAYLWRWSLGGVSLLLLARVFWEFQRFPVVTVEFIFGFCLAGGFSLIAASSRWRTALFVWWSVLGILLFGQALWYTNQFSRIHIHWLNIVTTLLVCGFFGIITWKGNDIFGLIVAEYRELRELAGTLSRKLQEERDQLEVQVAERTQVLQQSLSRVSQLQVGVLSTYGAFQSLGFYTSALLHNLAKPLSVALAQSSELSVPLQFQLNHMAAVVQQAREAFSGAGPARSTSFAHAWEFIDSLASTQAQLLGVQLRVAHPLPEVVVVGAQAEVQQVLSNVLQNSLEASQFSEERCVEVTWKVTRRTITVRIWNSGKAIARQQRRHMGTIFYSTKAESGRGLGLAYVYDRVGKLGGRVWFTSKTGRGTAFFIRLPVVQ